MKQYRSWLATILIAGVFPVALASPGPRTADVTLDGPGNRLVLQNGDTAIIQGTSAFDSTFNWMNVLYRRGTNDFINLALPLGLTGGTMPLAGPGVVMLNTNDPFVFGALYTGAADFQVVHKRNAGSYATLAYPADQLVLKSNETAVIVGTVPFDWSFNWMNILYQQGTGDPVNLILPLGLNGGTMPLNGPAVIRLNTNDAFVFGAEYTGAVGLQVVPQTSSERYQTLIRPDDEIVLHDGETAIIDGTAGFDGAYYSWVNILYRQGTNDFVNLILPLGLNGGTMPLSGPGVIKLNLNDAFVFGADYTGAVGFKIVRNSVSARYQTLAHPADVIALKNGETAVLEGTTSFDWSYNWMAIRYRQGNGDFVDTQLPLGINGETATFSGPGVIMLDAVDPFVYGADYTGVAGFKVIHTGNAGPGFLTAPGASLRK